MKKLITIVCALLLAGCSVGHTEWDSKAMDHTKLAFVGIPTVLGLGFTGTTTPITEKYSLTNKHVAYPTLRRIERTDKHCDLALIRQDNVGESLPKLATQATAGEEVIIYGYSGRTALPVSSKGVLLRYMYIDNCLVGSTTAGSIQGMSGGVVLNKKGELIGITYAMNIYTSHTLFVSISEINEFLAEGDLK